jgi:hypothetical protein
MQMQTNVDSQMTPQVQRAVQSVGVVIARMAILQRAADGTPLTSISASHASAAAGGTAPALSAA